MADRLSQLVRSMHGRLAAARRRVREQASDPDQLLKEVGERSASSDDAVGADSGSVWPGLRDGEEVADVDDTVADRETEDASLQCSRCQSELGNNPIVAEEGFLCRSCGEGLRTRRREDEESAEEEDAGSSPDGEEPSIKRSPICSRCLEPLGSDRVVTESAVYCRECATKAPHVQHAGDDRQQGHDHGDGSDRGGREEGGEPSIKESPLCSRCLELTGDNPVRTARAVYCQECAPKVHGLPGSDGDLSKDRDREDGGRRPARGDHSSPVRAWRNEDLSRLQQAILEELEGAHPEFLTARNLVDRLQEQHGLISVEKSDVNSELYGDLSDWLDRVEDTPPYWSLESEAPDAVDEDVGAAGDAGDKPRASNEDLQDDAVQLPDGGTMVRDSGQSTEGRSDSRPADAPESSYEMCSVCVTEREPGQVVDFRGRKVCRECLTELGIKSGE